MVKKLPASAGDPGGTGGIPGLGGSPGGGNGNPLQYSCLENPTDRGAWRATGHGVAKGGTQLSPAHSTAAVGLGMAGLGDNTDTKAFSNSQPRTSGWGQGNLVSLKLPSGF